MIKRVVNISKSKEEARKWDIEQAIAMSHEERQNAARIIKQRVYGKDNPDVKACHQK